MKAKAMTMDTSGKWVVDHFLRINVNHIVSFRVIEAVSKEEMIMEVYLVGRAIATVLAIQSADIAPWVKN